MTTYYKFLRADGRAPYQTFYWSLPTKNGDGTWKPGEWQPTISGDLVRCYRGYHATTPRHMPKWKNERLFVIEYDEEPLDATNKVVGRRARLIREVETWNRDSLRTFMVATVERLLGMIKHRTPRAVESIRKDIALVAGCGEGIVNYWDSRDRRPARRLAYRGIRHRGVRHLVEAGGWLVAAFEYVYIPNTADFLEKAADALAELSPRNLTYYAAYDELIDDLLVHLGERPVHPRTEAA